MGLTRADLIDPRVSDEDKVRIKAAIDNYMANDIWATKALKDTAILIISHPGGRPYLKGCVESHKKLGLWMTLAYDNYIDPAQPAIDHNYYMPAKEIMDAVDTFVMGHYQVWGGVLYPFFWSMKLGLSVLQSFKYIYCINGDLIIEKPENFPKLFELLGDADIMSCGPAYERMINTAGFLGKTEALLKIIRHFEEHFIPFDNYEKYTQEFGNAEGRFARAITDLGLKQVIVEPPCNEQLHVPGKGTWYDLLGFRHIHAEHNYAYRYKGIPPQPEYFDERFMGDEYKVIKAYWASQDKSILEPWWCKDV